MAKPIPLIGAGGVAGFSTLLDSSGVPAERYLERAGISPEVRENPSGFLPGRCVWNFIEGVSQHEGLRDFCLDVARLSDWRQAGWVPPLSRAATLGAAIRAMCVSYVREVPMVQLGLSVKGPDAWFWRRRIADVRGWDGNEPAEQYMLSFMLALIRAAAGPEWLPDQLKVESPASGWAAATAGLPGVRIQYGQSLLGVAIPARLLSLPVSIQARRPSAAPADTPPGTFSDSLRHVLRHWIPGGAPTERLAAEILGTSERTLRRRLAEEGASWRSVLHEELFRTAVARLQEGGATVSQVAQELGYSDASHFVRFFRNHAGVSPGSYREQVELARQLARNAPSG